MKPMLSRSRLTALGCALAALALGGCVIVTPEEETTLLVNLSWETGGGAFGDCVTAGVDTMDYELIDSDTGESVAWDLDVGCGASLEFEALASGNYELAIDGYRSGTLFWGSTCAGLSVDRGEFAEFFCDALIR